MATTVNHPEFVDTLATRLRELGLNAESADTGGGFYCIYVYPGSEPPDDPSFCFSCPDGEWMGERLSDGHAVPIHDLQADSMPARAILEALARLA